MLLLVFFFPVAIYLLILGSINRRRHPLVVSGVWDFCGILFAASGFLLVGGPAILSILSTASERWRWFWLLGRPPDSTQEVFWQTWVFLAIIYFVVVVAGSAVLLWRQRPLTSIYNVDPGQVEKALGDAFDELGLQPVRSGTLYLFGFPDEGMPPGGLQAPHALQSGITVQPALAGRSAGERDFLGQTAVLEVDSWASLRHITLRWDPADSLYRNKVEAQLEQKLAEVPARDSSVGGCLTLLGMGLLALLLFAAMVVLLLRLLWRL